MAATTPSPSGGTANNKAPLPICSPAPSEPSKNIVQASFANSTASSFDDAEKKSGIWEVLSTLYIPILLLWLRRSMFGTANLVRSLLLGHVLKVVVGLFMDGEQPHWWDALCEAPWFARTKKHDAWPPPAFTALAALTVLAFVVHPDGLTWIMLGKMRDAVVSLFTCLGNCLGTMKDTYGILPTLMASATFAALVCLVGILYKTLSRRSPRPVPAPPKKKKRKGHKKQRIRQQHSTQQQQQRQSSRKSTVIKPEKKKVVATTTPPRPVEKPARGRFLSGSTLDTCLLADDQSCGSTSVRSISSAPTQPFKERNVVNNNKSKRKKTMTKKPETPKTLEPPSPTLSSSSAPPNTSRRLDGRRVGKQTAPPVCESSSFFSQPSQSFFSEDSSSTLQNIAQQPVVRYNVPNYGAGDGRYTPEKMELAAFLARVGLVGTACADLLADLPHVDALELLTPDVLQTKYSIGMVKQREIRLLLEARRHERNAAAGMIRPPPGLGGVVGGHHYGHSSNVVGVVGGGVDATNMNLGGFSQTNSSLTQVQPPFGQPRNLSASSSPFGTPPYASMMVEPVLKEEEDSSQIEQELQELGGQMVTSVLDF